MTDQPADSETASLMPLRFRSRPVVIEAMYFDGTYDSALSVKLWAAGKVSMDNGDATLTIDTPEGLMIARKGDWIKGLIGEFYPCKAEVFLRKYEPIQPEPQA